jgi:hypothetical protein
VFASRRKGFEPATLLLAPSDGPGTTVELTDTGARTAADGRADVTVSGTAADIYRWLWNRPATVSFSGDPAAAEHWKKLRIRWS